MSSLARSARLDCVQSSFPWRFFRQPLPAAYATWRDSRDRSTPQKSRSVRRLGGSATGGMGLAKDCAGEADGAERLAAAATVRREPSHVKSHRAFRAAPFSPGWAAPRSPRACRLSRARAADQAVVGFIYVGPRDDFGYNQAHAEGAAALKKMAGVKVVEEERIPETVQVEKTMESMINLDGAGLLFPTSFGYFDPYILKEAAKYPKVTFEHCRGPVDRQGPEEHRQLFRLHLRGAVHQRHRRRLCLEDRQARLRRGEAHPAGAAEHQRLHAGRAARQSRMPRRSSSSPATGRCRSRRPRRPTA